MENGTGKNENWENWCFSKINFVHRGVESDTHTIDTMALRSSEMTHARGSGFPSSTVCCHPTHSQGRPSGSYKVECSSILVEPYTNLPDSSIDVF